MEPEPLSTVGLEFWQKFEADIEVPKPLRINKRSGTYTASNGSIESRQGEIIIPRRYSSRSGVPPSAQQEGPFGSLTIHKKRKARSTILTRSEDSQYELLSQLLDVDTWSISGAAHWPTKGSDGSVTPQSKEAMTEFFPFVNSTQANSQKRPVSPEIKEFSPPTPSFDFSLPLLSPPPDDHLPRPSIFKFSLPPRSFKRPRKEQATQKDSTLRDLANLPRVRQLPPQSTKLPQSLAAATTTQQHVSRTGRLTSRLKENFRRSSTVASLQSVFRKASLSRSISSTTSAPFPLTQQLSDDLSASTSCPIVVDTMPFIEDDHGSSSGSDSPTVPNAPPNTGTPSSPELANIVEGDSNGRQAMATVGPSPRVMPAIHPLVPLGPVVAAPSSEQASVMATEDPSPLVMPTMYPLVLIEPDVECVSDVCMSSIWVFASILAVFKTPRSGPCHWFENKDSCGLESAGQMLRDVTVTLETNPGVSSIEALVPIDIKGGAANVLVGSEPLTRLCIYKLEHGQSVHFAFQIRFEEVDVRRWSEQYLTVTIHWGSSLFNAGDNFCASTSTPYTIRRFMSAIEDPVRPQPKLLGGRGLDSMAPFRESLRLVMGALPGKLPYYPDRGQYGYQGPDRFRDNESGPQQYVTIWPAPFSCAEAQGARVPRNVNKIIPAHHLRADDVTHWAEIWGWVVVSGPRLRMDVPHVLAQLQYLWQEYVHHIFETREGLAAKVYGWRGWDLATLSPTRYRDNSHDTLHESGPESDGLASSQSSIFRESMTEEDNEQDAGEDGLVITDVTEEELIRMGFDRLVNTRDTSTDIDLDEDREEDVNESPLAWNNHIYVPPGVVVDEQLVRKARDCGVAAVHSVHPAINSFTGSVAGMPLNYDHRAGYRSGAADTADDASMSSID